MKNVLDWLNNHLILATGVDAKFFSTVILILILVLISRLMMHFVTRGKDVRIQYNIRKTIDYTTFIVGIFIVGRIWFPFEKPVKERSFPFARTLRLILILPPPPHWMQLYD